MIFNNHLESIYIEFDIFIDEENYDNVNIKFKDINLCVKWEKLVNLLGNPYKKNGKIIKILFEIEKLSNNKDLILNNVIYSYEHIGLWKYLFIAKKARAIIQKNGSTDALKAMDEVAEYLLSKLFETYKLKTPNGENIQFRVLYYNEISQCYKGYLSVGYADMALKEYPHGQYHYELLGLYNKAIGLAHHEDRKTREKALNYYEEIINAFRSEQNNLGYKKYRINKRLWKTYVYYPAIIQKADVLIRLQQGQESIELIRMLEEDKENGVSILTKYKRLSSLIIKAQALVEMGKYDEVKKILFNNLFKDRKYLKKYRIIWCKYKSIRVKYLIEFVKGSEIIPGKRYHRKIIRSLNNCKKLYLSAEDYGEKYEQIQAAIYWLEAFKLVDLKIVIQSDKEKDAIARLLLDDKILDTKRKNTYISKTITGLFFDIMHLVLKTIRRKDYNNRNSESNVEQWIPKREEVINLLSMCIEQFRTQIIDAKLINSKEICDAFAKKEKEFCEILINGFGNKKSSNYNRVKLQRRVERINLKISNENRDYHFPQREEINKVLKFTKNEINTDFYMRQLSLNTESFDEKLIYHSYWPELRNSYAFTVLRKWQSFTPSLGSYSTTSRGGGYFVYKVGYEGFITEGIVVDPGYDFIENFLEHKFSIIDINAIVFTHSHIDHSDNFRGLITLIHEMNNRASKEKYRWKTHKIRVVLTPSCFDLFYQIIVDCRDYIDDVVVVDDPDIKILPYENEINLKEFTIKAVPAYHKEIDNEANCVGLVIGKKKANKDSMENELIGFTGDTVWTRTLAKHLRRCSVVCVNMGAILDIRKGHCFRNTYGDENQVKKLIYEQNHLYLPGTITMIEELRRFNFSKIALIGELGEELKSGLREDLYHKINEFINKDNLIEKEIMLKVFIEDIGLTITWDKYNMPLIRCTRCKKSIIDNNAILRLAKDVRGSEQLYYYCDVCINVLESLETGVEENWQRRYLPPQ